MVEETMGQVKINLGSAGELKVNLEWRDDYESEGPIGKTWGDLHLWVADTLVWGEVNSQGGVKGVTWSWIDLLEFLGNAWPYLIEEEQYPINFESRLDEPSHLGELIGKAKLRFRTLSDEAADREDELLRDFLAVHDLSEAVHGITLSKLICMRRGRQMIVATTRQEFVISFDETMETFAHLGNAIAQRLNGLADKRAVIAISRWENRNEISELKRVQIATGISDELLKRVWPSNVNAVNDNAYELKAAARMLGRRVSEEQLKKILLAIGNLRSGNKLKLGVLWEKALDVIRECETDSPAIQGYFLAWMLREHVGHIVGRVDPERILSNWGVSVKKMDIPGSSLDAIAVWGERHTPTIFLNSAGPRSQQEKGRRSTLAHEMCHILVDLEGALPVADVLGGEVPRGIEKRANAFAAEFLLPRSEAKNYIERELNFVYSQDERNSIIERAIGELAEKYGASHETVAWQMLNSHVVDESDRQVYERKLKSIYDPFDAFAY